jgi:hypothetical protein
VFVVFLCFNISIVSPFNLVLLDLLKVLMLDLNSEECFLNFRFFELLTFRTLQNSKFCRFKLLTFPIFDYSNFNIRTADIGSFDFRTYAVPPFNLPSMYGRRFTLFTRTFWNLALAWAVGTQWTNNNYWWEVKAHACIMYMHNKITLPAFILAGQYQRYTWSDNISVKPPITS